MLYTYTAYILEYLVYFGILVATVTATSSLIGIKPPEQKYLALDGLRGICAALVAIFHLFWRNGGAADDYWSLDYISFSQVKSAIFITGQLPVGIFFMLSGFLFFKKALAPPLIIADSRCHDWQGSTRRLSPRWRLSMPRRLLCIQAAIRRRTSGLSRRCPSFLSRLAP